MKKVITGAILFVALFAGLGVYAQAPPQGPANPPLPGPGNPPPPLGPVARPPGPGRPGAVVQALTAFQGKVTKLSVNDDFIYDGFYLQTDRDSLLVKFPGYLGAQITSLVKAGTTVTVNGTLENPPVGGKEVRMVSLSVNGKTIYDAPPAGPPAPPSDSFVNGNGKVLRTQTDREGRMNGLLIDNGTVLRIPPGIASQLTDLAKNGSTVGYSGMQRSVQSGEVAPGEVKVVHCNTISINGQQFLVR